MSADEPDTSQPDQKPPEDTPQAPAEAEAAPDEEAGVIARGSLPILVLVLTMVCGTAALALVTVNEATKDRIAEQKRMLVVRSIRAVLPECENEPDQDTIVLDVDGKGIRGRPTTFYRGAVGGAYHVVAFELTTPEGYSGDISIMIGISRTGEVFGMEITDHKETPGLGALAAEPKFQAQIDERGRTLENTVWAVTKDDGELDAIAGATITPRAIFKAIEVGLVFFRDNGDAIFQAATQESAAATEG